jgi:hypothetical protein
MNASITCPGNHHAEDHKDQQYKDLIHQWLLRSPSVATAEPEKRRMLKKRVKGITGEMAIA